MEAPLGRIDFLGIEMDPSTKAESNNVHYFTLGTGEAGNRMATTNLEIRDGGALPVLGIG